MGLKEKLIKELNNEVSSTSELSEKINSNPASVRKIISDLKQEGIPISSYYNGKEKMHEIYPFKPLKELNPTSKRINKIGEELNYDIDYDEKRKYTTKSREHPILQLSDWHLGELIKDPESDPPKITYCSEIALELMTERIPEKIKKTISEKRKGSIIEEFDVFIQGDMIDGRDKYENQSETTNPSSIYSQAELAVRGLVKFFEKISDLFEKINVWMVPGNHGEIRKNEELLDNFELNTLYKDRLAPELEKFENIEYKIGTTQLIAEIEGYNFLIRHGHRLHRQEQTSAGEGKFINRINQVERIEAKLDEEIEGKIDYISLGHFHQLGIGEVAGKQIFYNGALPIGRGNLEEKLGVYSFPCQRLLFVHPEWGVTERKPIKFPGIKKELAIEESEYYEKTKDILY